MWAMGLAERLGMTLQQMLTNMSAKELMLWMTYDKITNKATKQTKSKKIDDTNVTNEFEKWNKFNHRKK
jgi:hypothetical protein